MRTITDPSTIGADEAWVSERPYAPQFSTILLRRGTIFSIVPPAFPARHAGEVLLDADTRAGISTMADAVLFALEWSDTP